MNVVGIRELDLNQFVTRSVRTAIVGRSAADRYHVLRSLLFACRHKYDDAYVVSRLVRSEWHRQMGTWGGCDDHVVSLQSFVPWIRARCTTANHRTLCVLDDPRTLPHLAAHVAHLRAARLGFIALMPTILTAPRAVAAAVDCLFQLQGACEPTQQYLYETCKLWGRGLDGRFDLKELLFRHLFDYVVSHTHSALVVHKRARSLRWFRARPPPGAFCFPCVDCVGQAARVEALISHGVIADVARIVVEYTSCVECA